NINQTGVNWEDYGEFKGQNTFNDDNADFGFSSGVRYYMFGGDDSDIPFNNFDGRGFTRNFGGGSNLNYDHKKTKLNASYFYNETRLNLDQSSLRQNFTGAENSFFNTDTTQEGNFRSAHNINSRWEQNLDSNNVLILKASSRIGSSSVHNRLSQVFSNSESLRLSRLSLDNSADLNTWRLMGTAIFRHRFAKKGRSFAVSAGYNGNQSDGAEHISSLNESFLPPLSPLPVRQRNDNGGNTDQWKSSLLYTEPLSKQFFWEAFYNFSQTANNVNRQVADLSASGIRVDSLSRFFDNRISYNRLGSTVRYSRNALNVGVGMAAQQIGLHGDYAVAEGAPQLAAPFDRRYTNYTPNVQIGYETHNHIWLSGEYAYNVEAPQLTDLQPVPNINNPAFRTEGNPDLNPARSHSISANVNYWNPSNFSNVGIGTDYSVYDEQIVYNQIISGTLTTTRPVNTSGGSRFNAYLWSNFPLVKTKLTMNLSGNTNINNTPAFVDSRPNDTRSTGFNVRLGFNITPNPKLIMDIGSNVGFSYVRYSIASTQNQNIQNHSLHTSLKWQFASKTFLESNFDYNTFRNDRFGFKQNIPIWNASVRRLVGKKNRLELRLAAFDLLNRRQSVTQTGTQNFVVRNIATTLARYYMLSATYNLKGYENKIKKNDWW
ncbi:MAG TPA: TonB-dependent receptor, partial [Saprospiraceae bacterium]|nr:TonB-dependent receptor [Saprospiraceae bacterium]